MSETLCVFCIWVCVFCVCEFFFLLFLFFEWLVVCVRGNHALRQNEGGGLLPQIQLERSLQIINQLH